jgi:hypothetical protein
VKVDGRNSEGMESVVAGTESVEDDSVVPEEHDATTRATTPIESDRRTK